MKYLGVAIAVIVLTWKSSFADERTWTDSTGSFKVVAELVDCMQGVVRLKKLDGHAISIPIERLCEGDQIIARRWGRPLSETIEKYRTELNRLNYEAQELARSNALEKLERQGMPNGMKPKRVMSDRAAFLAGMSTIRKGQVSSAGQLFALGEAKGRSIQAKQLEGQRSEAAERVQRCTNAEMKKMSAFFDKIDNIEEILAMGEDEGHMNETELNAIARRIELSFDRDLPILRLMLNSYTREGENDITSLRAWTSGEYMIAARLKHVSKGIAVLEDQNGKIIRVHGYKLCENDRDILIRWLEKEQDSPEGHLSEIDQNILEAGIQLRMKKQGFRKWAGNSYSIYGRLISIMNGNIILKTPEGKSAMIPCNTLTQADKEIVDNWREEKKSND